MSTTTITLSSGTSLSSGGNSGYRLAASTTAYTPTGTYKYTSPSYPIKITAVSVPWFGYSAASSNITVSGTITVKIGSATFTGTLSSTTLKTNTNVTGTVSCSGSAVLSVNTSYSVSVTCSGSNLLKSGTRFATNGKNLTGTWAANTYTITYKPGSSSTGSNYTQTKTAGTALTLRGATYSRSGYYQSGWATSDGGSQAYALSGSYTANAAATLYPVWTSYKANVKYHVNGGSITTGTGTTRYRTSSSIVQQSTNSGSSWSNLVYSFGKDTSYPNHWNVGTYGATRTGYHITGTQAYGTTTSGGILINQDYSSSSTTNAATVYRMNGNADLTANKDFTLYIHWIANTYSVVFNANGGSGTMSNESFTYGTAKALTSNAFTRTGFTFSKWNTKADGTGTNYTNGQSVSNLTSTDGGTVNLYAQWTPITYTISYSLGGGSFVHGYDVTHVSGTQTYPRNPTSLAYDNSNFSPESGTTMNSGFVVDTPTLAGYEFVGWTITGLTSATAGYWNRALDPSAWYVPDSGTSWDTSAFNPINPVFRYLRSTAGAVTFTAQWTASTYTVTLDDQNATTPGTATVTATYNANMPAATMPQRTNYTFGGYFDQTGGAGTQYYTDSGASAQVWDKTSDTILYAYWILAQLAYIKVWTGTSWENVTVQFYEEISGDFQQCPVKVYTSNGWEVVQL